MSNSLNRDIIQNGGLQRIRLAQQNNLNRADQSGDSQQSNRSDQKKLPRIASRDKTRTQSNNIGLNQKIGENFGNIKQTDNFVLSDNILLTKNIDQELNNSDMQARVRDLENKIIDIKASFERRLIQIAEENPQKFQRQFKNLEDKDAQLWRDVQQKQQNQGDALNILKEQVRNNNEIFNNALFELRKRQDDLQYKFINLERNSNAIEKFRGNSTSLLALEDKKSSEMENILVKNDKNDKNDKNVQLEIKLLREALNYEQNRRDVFFQDMIKQYQEINSKVMRHESEFLNRIKKNKEDLFEENSVSKTQNKRLEDLRVEKYTSDQEYLRQLIISCEKRVEEEIEKRLRNEIENKKWFEQKITVFRDEIKNDEKAILEGENKIMQQFQQSLQSLNLLIKSQKEQIEANLAQTQTLLIQNIEDLSKTVNVVKEDVYEQLPIYDNKIKELTVKVEDFREQIHQHAQTISQTLDEEFNKIEKVTQKFQEVQVKEMGLQNQKIDEIKVSNEQWKKEIAEKNFNIFVELNNNIKIIKNDQVKDKNDFQTKFSNMNTELDNYHQENIQLHQQMEKHNKVILEQFDFKIDELAIKIANDIENSKSKLQEDIIDMGKFTTEKTKKYTDSSINNLNEKNQKQIEQVLSQIRTEIQEESNKIEEEYGKSLKSVDNKIQGLIVNESKERENLQRNLELKIQQGDKELVQYKEEMKQVLKAEEMKVDNKIKSSAEDQKLYTLEKINDIREENTKNLEEKANQIRKDVQIIKSEAERLVKEIERKFNDLLNSDLEQLKKEFRKQIEEEQFIRNKSDRDLQELIESIKNMLQEKINQKTESMKALARALVNEEAAQRASQDEDILRTMKESLDAMEEMLRKEFQAKVNQLELALQTETNNRKVAVTDLKTWTETEFDKHNKKFEEQAAATEAKFYLEGLYKANEQKRLAMELEEINKNFEKNENIREYDRNIYQKNRYQDLQLLKKLNDANIQASQDLEQKVQGVEKELENHKQNSQQFQKETVKNFGDFEENLYQMDEKFSNMFENYKQEQQVKDYLNKLYDALKEEEQQNYSANSAQLTANLTKRVQGLEDKIEKNEMIFDYFEDKTEQNFKIAEQAIVSHEKFLNEIDARLTYEEIINKICHNKTQNDLEVASTQIDLVYTDIDEKFKEKLEQLERKVAEDIIPSALLPINDKLDSLKRFSTNENQINQNIGAEILSIYSRLDEYNKQIEQNKKKIKGCENLIEEVAINLMESSVKIKGNLERDLYINSVISKTNDKALQDYFYQNFQRMEEILDILADNQGGSSKASKKKSSDSNVNSEEIKELIDQEIKPKVDDALSKISKLDKSNDEQNKRIKELSSKIDEMMKQKLKSGDKNGDDNDEGRVTEEIKEELDKLKEIIQKIQSELDQKERENSNLTKKVESISNNMQNLENSMKNEFDKNQKILGDNQQVVVNQLGKLYEQFETVQELLQQQQSSKGGPPSSDKNKK